MKKKPELAQTLRNELAEETAGDPMSDKKWTRRSLRQLSRGLFAKGLVVSKNSLGRLLKDLNYSLKVNCRELSTKHYPERDQQMRYIKRVRERFIKQGYPVISVDAKKSELIGNFANTGRSWCEQAAKVNIYDVAQDAKAKALPYGIYDIAHNKGYVYVGTSGNTPEFAARAIASWWQNPQREHFGKEDKLFIFCDAGGANGHRFWSWKYQLQKQLADAFGITVIICHYPTGASKYNPIEHRLFSHISLNWAGQPLRSLAFMLQAIRGTVTQTGLRVLAYLLDDVFEKGKTITPEQKKSINLHRRPLCPNWNYVISPRPSSP